MARREDPSFRDEVAECRLRQDPQTGDLLLTCRGDGLQRLLGALGAPVPVPPAADGAPTPDPVAPPVTQETGQEP